MSKKLCLPYNNIVLDIKFDGDGFYNYHDKIFTIQINRTKNNVNAFVYNTINHYIKSFHSVTITSICLEINRYITLLYINYSYHEIFKNS